MVLLEHGWEVQVDLPGSVPNGTGIVVVRPTTQEVTRQRLSGLTGGGLGMYLATTSAIWVSVSQSQVLSGL